MIWWDATFAAVDAEPTRPQQEKATDLDVRKGHQCAKRGCKKGGFVFVWIADATNKRTQKAKQQEIGLNQFHTNGCSWITFSRGTKQHCLHAAQRQQDRQGIGLVNSWRACFCSCSAAWIHRLWTPEIIFLHGWDTTGLFFGQGGMLPLFFNLGGMLPASTI